MPEVQTARQPVQECRLGSSEKTQPESANAAARRSTQRTSNVTGRKKNSSKVIWFSSLSRSATSMSA